MGKQKTAKIKGVNVELFPSGVGQLVTFDDDKAFDAYQKQQYKLREQIRLAHVPSGKEFIIDDDGAGNFLTIELLSGHEYKKHWESTYGAKIDYVRGMGCVCDACNDKAGPSDDVYHMRSAGNDYQSVCVKCGEGYVAIAKRNGNYKLVA
jgi:hypothetical protein